MAFIETHHYSKTLGMEMQFNIILPQERQPYKSEEKLKVLWLLHGGSGDSTAWSRMSNIERYALEYGIAVVMPGVYYSCCTDMEHGGRYCTYLADELPVIVHNMFSRLSKLREDNIIGGFSNGGYGCFKVGLTRPDVFGVICALSAGDKSDVPFVNDGSRKSLDRITLFGDKSIKGTNNDLKHLAIEAIKSGKPLPKIYHACGSLDPWLDLNLIMCDFFLSDQCNDYDYTYHQADNLGHTWEFWDTEIPLFLQFMELQKDSSKYICGL